MIDDNEPVVASGLETNSLRSAYHDDAAASARASGKAQVGDGTCRHSRMRRNPALAAHRAAVANTLTWAAARADFVDALAWLNVLDAIGETLPDEYEIKRLDWRRALVQQPMRQARHDARTEGAQEASGEPQAAPETSARARYRAAQPPLTY